MPVLTALRPTEIRDFVFASNRLSEIAAGATTVAWATSGDAGGAPRQAGLDGGELLQASAGDLCVRFAEMAEARTFAARYTRLLYEDAPGLTTVIAHLPYETGQLGGALRAARPALVAAASHPRPHLSPLGLGVTALCRESGAPASEVLPAAVGGSGGLMLVSAGIAQRRRMAWEAIDARWQPYLPDSAPADGAAGDASLALPQDMGTLARMQGANGEVGIIQIETGRLDRVGAATSEPAEGEDADAAAVAAYAATLAAVVEGGAAIVRAVLRRAAEAIPAEAGGRVLPVRPLLWEGDRLTLLAAGELVDALVAATLAAVEALPPLGTGAAGRPRVGVAILPAYAALGAGYDLAVRRCRAQPAARVRGGSGRSRGAARGRSPEMMTVHEDDAAAAPSTADDADSAPAPLDDADAFDPAPSEPASPDREAAVGGDAPVTADEGAGS